MTSSTCTVRKSILNRVRPECSARSSEAGCPRKGAHRRFGDDPHLGVELDRLLGLGPIASIALDMLRRGIAAGAVPLVVVVTSGAVAYPLPPASWIKGYGILGHNPIQWDPPVHL